MPTSVRFAWPHRNQHLPSHHHHPTRSMPTQAILRRLPRQFEIALPNARDRARILEILLREENVDRKNAKLERLAQLTVGCVGVCYCCVLGAVGWVFRRRRRSHPQTSPLTDDRPTTQTGGLLGVGPEGDVPRRRDGARAGAGALPGGRLPDGARPGGARRGSLPQGEDAGLRGGHGAGTYVRTYVHE